MQLDFASFTAVHECMAVTCKPLPAWLISLNCLMEDTGTDMALMPRSKGYCIASVNAFLNKDTIQNQDYISAYGSLLAELGKSDEAIQVLQNCIQRFPEEGYEKYM